MIANLLSRYNFLLKKILLSILLLSFACKSTPLLEIFAQREPIIRARTDYESYLALEYLQFARYLQSIREDKVSDYFAKKGLAITDGYKTIPENPEQWKVDHSQREEMILMQDRIELLEQHPRLKKLLPVQLAHLNYLYDCWVTYESSQIAVNEGLSYCHARLSNLMDELERYVDNFGKSDQPRVVITEPKFKRFEVVFDYDNDKLNDKGNKDLIEALNYIRILNGSYRILLVGNADRSGSSLYNQNLAIRRATVVKNYLAKNGVFRDLIELRSEGEDIPDLITRDGIKEQSNRVVGIYVLEGLPVDSEPPLPLIQNHVYRNQVEESKRKKGISRK